MTDVPNLNANNEDSWTTSVEEVGSEKIVMKPPRLVKVAILISVLSLLLSGYSLLKSQSVEPKSSGLSADPANTEGIDLFQPPKDLSSFIETVEESVVAIECEGNEDGIWSYGTGFVSEFEPETDGFKSVIVTNHHVIEDCIDSGNELIVLTGTDQTGAPRVNLLRWDEENDLAIIEVDELLPGLISAETFASRGWWSMAIGNPLETDFEETIVLYNSTTFGYISYVLDGKWNYTSATINGGNSGGPLVNSRGELIGINTLAAASTEGGVWNVAVDSDILCEKIYTDCATD
jgi:S1-C subfamily serine protease